MRHVLMIEVEGDDAIDATERLVAAFPEAVVWGQVDPVEAALLVLDGEGVPMRQKLVLAATA